MRSRALSAAAVALPLTALSMGRASAASPTWKIQTTPSPAGRSAALADISCVSASSCVAVGSSSKSGIAQRIVQRWNGTTWKVEVTPGPAAGVSNALWRVSCASGICVAIGSTSNGPLIERWNGTAWKVDAITISGAEEPSINDVACTSKTNCIAVGRLDQEFLSNTPALVLRWNGTTWSRMTPPSDVFTYDELIGITCTSATNCLAVGSRFDPSGCTSCEGPFVLRWNGTKWSDISAPRPPGTDGAVMDAVACRAANDCFASGHSTTVDNEDVWRTRRMVQRWNGSTWAISVTPAPPAGAAFSGIACAGGDCVIVGGTGNQLLAERFHNGAWTIESVTKPASGGAFGGVACTSRLACTAVGYTRSNVTLAEHSG